MIDFDLARKFLNSTQKTLIEAQQSTTDLALDALLKSAIGKIDLLYDILHLTEIDIIDPNK